MYQKQKIGGNNKTTKTEAKRKKLRYTRQNAAM